MPNRHPLRGRPSPFYKPETITLEILGLLPSDGSQISAAALTQKAADQGINQKTLYRYLRRFVRVGVVVKIPEAGRDTEAVWYQKGFSPHSPWSPEDYGWWREVYLLELADLLELAPTATPRLPSARRDAAVAEAVIQQIAHMAIVLCDLLGACTDLPDATDRSRHVRVAVQSQLIPWLEDLAKLSTPPGINKTVWLQAAIAFTEAYEASVVRATRRQSKP